MVWRLSGYIYLLAAVLITSFGIQPIDKTASARSPDSLTALVDIRQSVLDDRDDAWLGKRVTVGGIVNVASGLLHERCLQIFIQNDSTGLSLFDKKINQSVAAGDSIIATGVVQQYLGVTEVLVEEYEVFPEKRSTVISYPLSQAIKFPDHYEGMLIKDEGVVRSKGTHFNGKYLVIAPNDTSYQTMKVYVSNFHSFYQEFDFESLSTGDKVTFNGVLSKHLADPQAEMEYKIFLRVPSDLKLAGIPKIYFWLSAGVLSCIFIFILAWVWMLKVQVRRQTSVIGKALRDKEVLLQEIHHRVKNNLAIISGLIELQLDSTSDEVALQVLRDSQARIQAMAMVHEKLYTSAMNTSVQMDIYIKELVEAIHHTFNDNLKGVETDFCLEPVELDLQQVIPCGLLINELVVNAFKHAFNGKKAGRLRVSLQSKNDQVELIVADNGPGLSEDISVDHTGSLGFMLIQTFADQLSAEMNVDGKDGTEYTFLFQPKTV